jgi:hypothetical protein
VNSIILTPLQTLLFSISLAGFMICAIVLVLQYKKALISTKRELQMLKDKESHGSSETLHEFPKKNNITGQKGYS